MVVTLTHARKSHDPTRPENLQGYLAVNAFGGRAFQCVLGTKLQKALKVLPDGGHMSGLEGQYIVAMVVLGQLQGSAAGVETITRKTHAKLREIPTKLGK